MEYIRVGLFRKFYFKSEFRHDKGFDVADLSYKNKPYIIKKYNNSEDFFNEVRNINQLDANRIRIPKVIKINKKDQWIIEEVPEGVNCLDLVSSDQLTDKIIENLFIIYRFCRFTKNDIDYLPQSFLVTKKSDLIYIGRKIFPQNTTKNLENYGLRFWLDSKEAKINCKENGKEFKRQVRTDAEINKNIVLLSIKYW